MTDIPVVIIESPYAGDVETHEEYARRCMYDSLMRGEAPYLSHMLYTQVLDDTNPDERKRGMEAGWAFIDRSDYTVVYQDYGLSSGMKGGIAVAEKLGHKIEYRNIGKNEEMTNEKKIEETLDLLFSYGQIDGGHHKAWCIDQAVRILSGDRYEEAIKEYEDGEDGPHTYDWDEGIAP